MIWTTQHPTTPGWYWLKDSETPDGPIDRPIVVEIVHRQDGNLGFYLDLDAYAVHEAGSNAKWAGPLPLPEDAPPAVVKTEIYFIPFAK